MRFAKIVFTVAGVYGLLILVPQFFLEGKYGRDLPPPVNHPENYYGFLCVAVVWQVAFLILARDPVRYRPMMIAAVLEKWSFVVAIAALYLAGRVAPLLLLPTGIDLLLGALFLAAYLKTPRRDSPPA